MRRRAGYGILGLIGLLAALLGANPWPSPAPPETPAPRTPIPTGKPSPSSASRPSWALNCSPVLYALRQDGVCVTPEVVRRLSPYLTEHIKRFGQYVLDMDTGPEPLHRSRASS